MKSTKTWFSVTLLACFVLAAGLIGCQNDPSDETIDKIADRIAQNPPRLHEDTVNNMVNALMAHPKYLEYLEDDEDTVNNMVDALMAHPKYLEYLEDDEWVEDFTNAIMAHPMYQTTPEEDCVTVILMAAVMSGDYTLPPESDVDRLCAWYISQSE